MSEDLDLLRARLRQDKSLTLSIKVIPKSPRTQWAGILADGSYKVRLHAVPEKGKANDELIRFLASEFDLPRTHIEILSGHTNPHKHLRLRGTA